MGSPRSCGTINVHGLWSGCSPALEDGQGHLGDLNKKRIYLQGASFSTSIKDNDILLLKRHP